MTPTEAIKSIYSNYANFEGRATRTEYWIYALFYWVCIIGIVLVTGAGNGAIAFAVLFILANIVPSISVSVRRLHDTNKSGWLLLATLVPIIGPILMLVWSLQASYPLDNAYGAAQGAIKGH